jgi:probable rRNA maturation factor
VIDFFSEDVDIPNLDYKLVKKWIKTVIETNGFKASDISIIFCSDKFLLEYNRKFLSHDYLTDIITFNYNIGKKISGDLYISIDTVKKNSVEYAVLETDEFLRVIIHGVLHLLGFNDKTEDEILIMREQEAKALVLYSFP